MWKWLYLPVIEHSPVKKTPRGSPFGIVIPVLNIHLLYETRLAGRYGIYPMNLSGLAIPNGPGNRLSRVAKRWTVNGSSQLRVFTKVYKVDAFGRSFYIV